MNHSSILQIHLNGSGKFIVRWRAFDKDLFSCLSLFFSLFFPSFVKGLSDQKAKSRLKQQVRRLKGCRNLQVNWKAVTDKKTESRSFKGFAVWGQFTKSGWSKMLEWLHNLLKACDKTITERKLELIWVLHTVICWLLLDLRCNFFQNKKKKGWQLTCFPSCVFLLDELLMKEFCLILSHPQCCC